ncbi:hypothetical protein JCM19232_1680 [Vibrio ishigakensis]|uniref:Outer membrane protein beta-barrel domain-containing protein n=1 Tax=Vibrio ishigakensis TaxID=1481914 RepID=A0A0B8PHF1_9VIBR|nr:hypothetical protein JCM19232_1680 [Vibrio ishigakensis]
MKKTAALIASLSLLSIPAIAQDEVAEPKAQGHRIGLGFASTEEPDLEVSFGKGLKLEYGYEFNNIVGINLSYAGFGEDVLGGLFKVEAQPSN